MSVGIDTPELRPEQPTDAAAIDVLLVEAFGGEDEARLVRALREGGYLLSSIVAVIAGDVVGHVAFSPLPIEQPGGVVRGASLAPLAVAAAHRRAGIGEALVRAGLQAVHRRGADAIVVLGEPTYYRRFGFSAELAARLSAPFSGPSFMALELMPAALSRGGRVRYAPPFGLGSH